MSEPDEFTDADFTAGFCTGGCGHLARFHVAGGCEGQRNEYDYDTGERYTVGCGCAEFKSGRA